MLRIFIVLFVLFTSSLFSTGQTVSESQRALAKNVDVSQLSDSQIQEISQKIEASGMTVEQAIVAARAQGASEKQLDDLRVRLGQNQTTTSPDLSTDAKVLESQFPVEEEEYSVRSEDSFTLNEEIEKPSVFGSSLFNEKELSFEPSLTMPTPDFYVLSAGDVLDVVVWGASQANYQLTVDTNGMIHLPDVGPIRVGSMPYKQVASLVKNRLKQINAGMGGAEPSSFASVNLTELHSIKVNVIGEALMPGSYTLPATASAFNALYLAGGPNEQGSLRTIQVLRGGKCVKTIDVYDYLLNGDAVQNIALRDQDILYIPTYTKRVTLEGKFLRPTAYELSAEETLADVIAMAGGFAADAYSRQLPVKRYNGQQLSLLNVEQQHYDQFALSNGDIITAGEIVERYTNRVAIFGAVFRPGMYELKDGMTLQQLLKTAEGLREDAYLQRATITRLNQDMTLSNISFDVKTILQNERDIVLQREDMVQIESRFNLREEQLVHSYGELNTPGEFIFKQGMTLGDLLLISGGFKEDADVSFVEVARRISYDQASQVSDVVSESFRFDISRDLSLKNGDQEFVLEPFDAVYVRRAPGRREQGNVTISGEIVYAGQYRITNKQMRISDAIERAGGIVPGAYVKGATLVRATMLTEEEYETREKLMVMDSTLNLDLDKTVPIGINLEQILANPYSNTDLILRDGDVITIPKKLQTIKVSGAVMNPVGLTYEAGRSLKHYIDGSGGFSLNAKKAKSYVIYANGTTASTKGFLGIKNYPKLEPGAEIIVPERPDRGDQTSKWISITSATVSLGVSIATMVSLL